MRIPILFIFFVLLLSSCQKRNIKYLELLNEYASSCSKNKHSEKLALALPANNMLNRFKPKHLDSLILIGDTIGIKWDQFLYDVDLDSTTFCLCEKKLQEEYNIKRLERFYETNVDLRSKDTVVRIFLFKKVTLTKEYATFYFSSPSTYYYKNSKKRKKLRYTDIEFQARKHLIIRLIHQRKLFQRKK